LNPTSFAKGKQDGKYVSDFHTPHGKDKSTRHKISDRAI